jgi:hypothetical protein
MLDAVLYTGSACSTSKSVPQVTWILIGMLAGAAHDLLITCDTVDSVAVIQGGVVVGGHHPKVVEASKWGFQQPDSVVCMECFGIGL